jgi:hypothetical protein
MTSSLFSKLILMAALTLVNCGIAAASDYRSVVKATQEIIAGRAFENEDGTRIYFSKLKLLNLKRAELAVTISYTDGLNQTHEEAIVHDGPQIRMEQTLNGAVTGEYLVSLEDPFHVLRIRPINTDNTNFISRECLYQENYRLNVCYIKMKSENDVFVSIYREVKNQ